MKKCPEEKVGWQPTEFRKGIPQNLLEELSHNGIKSLCLSTNKSLVQTWEITLMVSFCRGQSTQKSSMGTCSGTGAFQYIWEGDVHRCYSEQKRWGSTVKLCRISLLGVAGRWNRRWNLVYISTKGDKKVNIRVNLHMYQSLSLLLSLTDNSKC